MFKYHDQIVAIIVIFKTVFRESFDFVPDMITLTNWKRLDNRANNLSGCGRLKMNCWGSILQELCQTVLTRLLKALHKQRKGSTPAGL